MFLFAYNIVGSYDVTQRWQARLRFWSKCLGCYDIVTDPNLMPE